MCDQPATTPPSSAVIVIFGAGGDLTWRKLIPALYDLSLDRWLPENFAIIGMDRKEMSIDEFRSHLQDGVDQFSRRGKTKPKEWDPFSGHVSGYIDADFDDPKAFSQLGDQIAALEKEWGQRSEHLFYFAVPPFLIQTIAAALEQVSYACDPAHDRLVIEKPFGHDLASAEQLNQMLTKVFSECQIYRIDHYLGKETVQNILAFRFGNALFEPIWDRRYIDSVQITVAEEVGVEHRGSYYEKAGALRDMIQNHMLQLLCLIAMEPPVSFNANEIRNKKVDVLHAIRPMPVPLVHTFAVRGQYSAGWLEGEHVPSYRNEPGVAEDSLTETYAAVKLYVDNWRWQDVPFYLRTGKRMPLKLTEIEIQFKPVPHQAFPPQAVIDFQPNSLIMRIQPEEAILLRFQAKRPGPHIRLSTQEMHFSYREAYSTVPPEAYETLLLDAIHGDATLFMRADQVEAAWAVLMPIIEAWEASPPVDFPNYPAGTWGPEAAEVLIARDGRSWTASTVLQAHIEEKKE